MLFKEYLSEGFFSSGKKIRELYVNFNKFEGYILNIANITNGAKLVGGGKSDSPLERMIQSIENNTDGMKIAKKNRERIKEMNKLAEELLSISNEFKTDVNSYFLDKYPKEMKKLS